MGLINRQGLIWYVFRRKILFGVRLTFRALALRQSRLKYFDMQFFLIVITRIIQQTVKIVGDSQLILEVGGVVGRERGG